MYDIVCVHTHTVQRSGDGNDDTSCTGIACNSINTHTHIHMYAHINTHTVQSSGDGNDDASRAGIGARSRPDEARRVVAHVFRCVCVFSCVCIHVCVYYFIIGIGARSRLDKACCVWWPMCSCVCMCLCICVGVGEEVCVCMRLCV